MFRVAGSLWSVPQGRQIEAVRRLQKAGLDRLHWDTSDGIFARAGGFTPEQAEAISQATGLNGEAHLMVDDPISVIDAWVEVCDLVMVHIEVPHWRKCIDRIVHRSGHPGIVISPNTPLRGVPNHLPTLCMSITPGQAGSRFDNAVLNRVADLKEAAPERPVGVDGGIRLNSVDALAKAGADWIVVGTDLFLNHGESRWSGVLNRVSTPGRN